MDERARLTERFEEHRTRLRAVAYRMLGSLSEADDAVRGHPEHEALLADAVGLALLVVLDTLTPAERLAFVLLDMFAVPFEDIAPVIERSCARGHEPSDRPVSTPASSAATDY
jgi:RNA polymerase sigma-70 factor (ECF subfamily)